MKFDQVEFEARTAEKCDFHGIKALLKKLFDVGGVDQVDLTALTEFVIEQRSVGSVITQSRKQQVRRDLIAVVTGSSDTG